MNIIVQKFGGTSVDSKEKLEKVASRIIDTYKKGIKVVAIVSAQGKMTDQLILKAKEYSNESHSRELDLLLCTGELQTVALLTMMLKDKGYSAIALTGEQAGVITTSEYGNAKISRVINQNLIKYLENDTICIVAGFQGVDRFGNITTLGRGGSDLSAVAIASSLKAKRCEIYTDVDGIYSADPKIVSKTKLLSSISYEEMLEAATCGAKVLHNRSVGVARIFNMPVFVKNTEKGNEGTVIQEKYKDEKPKDEEEEKIEIEKYGAKIITKSEEVAKISIVGDSLISYPDILGIIFANATMLGSPIIMITVSEICINIIVKKEASEELVNVLHDKLIDNK